MGRSDARYFLGTQRTGLIEGWDVVSGGQGKKFVPHPVDVRARGTSHPHAQIGTLPMKAYGCYSLGLPKP